MVGTLKTVFYLGIQKTCLITYQITTTVQQEEIISKKRENYPISSLILNGIIYSSIKYVV